VVGSAVTATDANPVNADAVAPNETEVDPTVTEELVRLPLAILVSVLDDPLIVLFVSVCVPVNVATVESMAIVTADEPLYDVPVSPVPIVKAFDAVAVTVPDPPREIDDPFTVIELFVSPAFGIEATAVNALEPFPTR
jgi:hypothetical protein